MFEMWLPAGGAIGKLPVPPGMISGVVTRAGQSTGGLREQLMGANVGNRAFLYGGMRNETTLLNDQYELTTGTPPTFTGKAAHGARAAYAMCAASGAIYVAGGAVTAFGNTWRTLYRYDVAANTWSVKAAPVAIDGKVPLHMLASMSFCPQLGTAGQLAFSGGYENDTIPVAYGPGVNRILMYDIASNSWAVKAAVLPESVWGHATCVVGDWLYVFGGAVVTYAGPTRSNKTSRKASRYHLIEDRWEALPDMPLDVACLRVSVVGGVIYGFGGFSYLSLSNTTKVPKNRLWGFDTTTLAFYDYGDVGTPRYGHAQAFVNNQLWVVSGDTPEANTESYEFFV